MNIKRIIAGGAALATGAMTLLGAGFGQTINDPELDMAIDWMYDNGMTKYDSEATFMPWGNLTREQSAKFTAGTETDGGWAEGNLCLEPIEGTSCDFSDVPADPTLEGSVVKACLLGMVKGSNGMFYPTAEITKAEFLTIVVRAIRAAAGEDPVMDESMTPWWKGYFDEARDLGLTKETDVFALDRSITRYEAALILYRARIEDPVCGDTTDWTDWLDDLLGDDDDDTDDDDMDDDDVVYNGNLSASLNPETPKGTTVPGLATVWVASFDVQADGDAELQSVMLERLGLGNKDAVEEVSLMINGKVVSKTKDFDDDGTVELDLNKDIALEDGELVTVDVLAKIGDKTVASNQEFAIALIGLNDEEVSPVVANEFEVGGVNAVRAEVDMETGTDTVQVGDKDVEFARFDIENDDDDYDIYITSITLEDDENNMKDALENFTLEFDGDVVATVESVDDDILTFIFDTPLVIEDGQTEDFEVHADVIAGVDDMIALIIDEENFVVGYDGNFMYGLDVTGPGGAALNKDATVVTIEAGEVALEEIHLDQDEIRQDRQGYILAAFDMTINAGSDVELDQMTFTVDDAGLVGTATMAKLFEEIELHIDGNSEDVETISSTLVFEDLSMTLDSGTTYRVEIVGDTADDLEAWLGSTFNIEFDAMCGVSSCTNFDMEDADGETILDITPETMVFDELTLVEPGVFISDISMADVDVVIGSTLVDFLQFQIETDDVSGAEFKSVRISDISNFDDDHVETLTLWRETDNGWIEIESESGNDIDGDVTLDGFNEEIPMSTTQVFMLTIDVTSNEANTGDVEAEIIEMELEDDENDDIDVSGQLPIGSRVVTIVGAGSLDVSFDSSNTQTDEDMYILGGKVSDYVAAFELSAEDEKISIESMSLIISGSAADFADAVSRVWLFDEDGNSIYGNGAVVGADVAVSGEVTFNNLNPELVVGFDEDTVLYVALQTKRMGDNQQADVYGAGDFSFALEVTEADGVTSNIDITTTAVYPGDFSNFTAIRPVLVSDLELSDYDNAELNSSTQRIGTLMITADDWNNNKEAVSSEAELGLLELAVNYYGDFSGFRLRSSVGATTVAGTALSGVVTFDMTALSESNQILEPGEVATFYIELDGSMAPAPGESVTLEFDESAGSNLEYSEFEDSTCASAACVTGGLRLGQTLYGSASASRQS